MTLAIQLQAVTAQVKQQAPAAVIDTMEQATQQLIDSGFINQAIKIGQRFPDFVMPDATGESVSSKDLLARGPVVISFYRGAWCPYCNLELAELQAKLPQIQAAGATLVAISPQTPDNSLTSAEKNGLQFPVLSDTDNVLARQIGIVFTLPESLHPLYQAFGIDLEKSNGTNTFELPVPATYLIGRDGTVLEAWLDVDYRNRLEPDSVIGWLKQHGNKAAA